MTLDAGGRLLIDGTSSINSTYKIQAGGSFQSISSSLISITDTATVYRGTPDGSGFEHAKVFSGREASTFTYGSFLAFYTEGKNSGTTDTSVERGRFSSDGTFRVKGAGTAGSTDAFQVAGTAPASSMVLDSIGNVGIGVASPGYKFDVLSTGAPAQFSSSNASNTLIQHTNTSAAKDLIYRFRQNAGAGNFYDLTMEGATNAFTIDYNDTERARIDSGGVLKVGPNPTNIRSSLFVVGSAFSTGTAAEINNTDNSSWIPLAFHTSGNLYGYISSSSAGTNYNTVSDYRLKTVIGAVTGAGQRIDALQPIAYTWNSSGESTRGFLAHQFQEVYAGSVSGTKDAVDAEGKPVYQAMQASTSEVIADLVAELQSLRARVATLESSTLQ
jgi:hypothetical protein